MSVLIARVDLAGIHRESESRRSIAAAAPAQSDTATCAAVISRLWLQAVVMTSLEGTRGHAFQRRGARSFLPYHVPYISPFGARAPRWRWPR